MNTSFLLLSVALLGALALGAALLVWWGGRWGSTAVERNQSMPGDEYLDGDAKPRIAMTRATWVSARPEQVWPWIAQLGRGAGWYSVDLLDNTKRVSAQHIVSWIPEPRAGDATAIGYLRHIDRGRSLAWWADGARFFGARTQLVTSYVLTPSDSGTRLVSRMSAVATGPTAGLAVLVFRIVDSIMATRQLVGIRTRVERSSGSPGAPTDPETGARDQYQLYEVLYADGRAAGVPDKEDGRRWRRQAVEQGVISTEGQEHDRHEMRSN